MRKLFPRYPSVAIRAISILCCALAIIVSGIGAGSDIADEVVNVIKEYRTADPSAEVRVWQSQITHPSRNPKFKEFQAQRLKEWETTEFAPYRLNNPALIVQLREVLMPVLRLYRRQDCFQIILINHKVPVMMNDSGVLLMVSTGLIETVDSEEELWGHVAHELGHDLFWRRTIQARGLLELKKAREEGTSPLVRRALAELSKIELECDAFAAVTVAALNRNPVSFGRYLQNVEHDFPDYIPFGLPPAALRMQVIAGVIPEKYLRLIPQTTDAFRKLKAMLRAENSSPAKDVLTKEAAPNRLVEPTTLIVGSVVSAYLPGSRS